MFAGGGHRCWWQAGFWDCIKPELDLRPHLIVGTSAGAATACLLYARDARDGLAYYDELLAGGKRNFYWGNLFKRDQRIAPHEHIYRTALAHLFDTESFKQLMWTAPQIRIVYSRLPSWLGPRSGAFVGMATYSAEKHFRKPLHPTWGRALGFKSEYAVLQDCTEPAQLVSLLMASACTPPLTSIEFRDERATLDGGMVDNVPVHAVEPDQSTLVLLSRQYSRHAPMFARDGHVYVQPSEKVPTSSWDYSQSANYRATYELGLRDGASFLRGFLRE